MVRPLTGRERISIIVRPEEQWASFRATCSHERTGAQVLCSEGCRGAQLECNGFPGGLDHSCKSIQMKIIGTVLGFAHIGAAFQRSHRVVQKLMIKRPAAPFYGSVTYLY